MFKKYAKKIGVVLVAVSVCISSLLSVGVFAKESSIDYSLALSKSILFYDANKCGKDVDKDNVFDWRGPCHVDDGQDVDLNLSGGFHDAGDHVKFGITQGYSASVLGWSLYEFNTTFKKTKNNEKLLSTLKHFTDYFLKSHPQKDIFYYDIGQGDIDHAYWGPPETQTDSRPVLGIADKNNPASDICGMTSASLTLMYLNYKKIDRSYANKCLKAAKELYEMGKSNQGLGKMNNYYPSFSYEDDLAWAAVWLYVAERNPKYIKDVKSYIYDKDGNPKDSFFKNQWTMTWNDMSLPVMCMMAKITGKKDYKNAVKFNLNHWKDNVPTTPGGLKYLNQWGVLRYSAAESMIALVYYGIERDPSLKEFAKSQIDYILGKNPNEISYVIGFGSKFPTQPHHRAASGLVSNLSDQPALYELTGALVGGPRQDDSYNDSVMDYVSNGAICYVMKYR